MLCWFVGGVPLCKTKQTAKVMVYEILFVLHSGINSLTDVETGEQKSSVCLFNKISVALAEVTEAILRVYLTTKIGLAKVVAIADKELRLMLRFGSRSPMYLFLKSTLVTKSLSVNEPSKSYGPRTFIIYSRPWPS